MDMIIDQNKPAACLVIPTYNEAENIEQCIELVFSQQAKIDSHNIFIVVVDDKSPDGTSEIVKRLQEKYPRLLLLTGSKRGLGDAYKRGFYHAIEKTQPEFIIQMDADGQHDPNLIPLFLSLGNHGFSLVIGSRFTLGGSTPDFSIWRTFLSRAGNFLIRHLGGIARIRDCTSGYRCIKSALFQKCKLDHLSTRGYSFQSSLMCELLREGAKPIEVPIVFADRKFGRSKLSLKDQIEFLLNIGRIRFRNSEEFIRYCAVGVAGLVVNLGFYLLCTRIFSMSPETSAPIAIEISILNNFLLNNGWTFRKRPTISSLRRRLVKFHIAAGTAGIVNYLVFLSTLNLFNINDLCANLLGIGFGMFVNYSINSSWTWKQSKSWMP